MATSTDERCCIQLVPICAGLGRASACVGAYNESSLGTRWRGRALLPAAALFETAFAGASMGTLLHTGVERLLHSAGSGHPGALSAAGRGQRDPRLLLRPQVTSVEIPLRTYSTLPLQTASWLEDPSVAQAHEEVLCSAHGTAVHLPAHTQGRSDGSQRHAAAPPRTHRPRGCAPSDAARAAASSFCPWSLRAGRRRRPCGRELGRGAAGADADRYSVDPAAGDACLHLAALPGAAPRGAYQASAFPDAFCYGQAE